MKTRWKVVAGLLCMVAGVIAQPVNRFIIIDQFGYLPESKKIAVLKDPVTGFDAALSFTPGSVYVVVDANSGNHVFRGTPVRWNSGNTDVSSGDKVWHFDFSGVTQTGKYYVLDSVKNERSYEFEISHLVYNEVLKQAVRMFFYQRAGFAKEAQYAGSGWADGASHIGPLQDKNCRIYNDRTNAATERDLSGGWYDAGDYNKYTNWTSNYVVEMMKAYIENPNAWGDDYNIPESGNGIPDLIDEAKWGIDHLLRMQEPDGSVLCIVSESHASPPSSATGQSVYGPATTSASLNTAAAFAISARVFRSLNMTAYTDTLIARAEKAWNWAVAHPAVKFDNNSADYGSLGVGAGNQEEDDYGRSVSKLEASCFLYEATQEIEYKNYFDSYFDEAHMIQWNYIYPYEPIAQDLLLYYTQIQGATASVITQIKNVYLNAISNNGDNFPAYFSVKDPYLAHMSAYTWGSNNQKGVQGSSYFNVIRYKVSPAKNQDAYDAALGFVHYIHGVNPLNITYLSNMYAFGGDSCVNEFYHSWFCNGSDKWDRVGTSLYGPPPGFLPGGPNPSYDWDGCCNTPNCGSTENNTICASESLTPPKGQPKQKSYKDFNTSWPLNSWSVTENSCGYQVSYIKLLSKFVKGYDCHGDFSGTAYLDTCGICSGGNTGRTPETTPCNCPNTEKHAFINDIGCNQYVSASGKFVWTSSGSYTDTLAATAGCDSIIHYQLIINHPTESYFAVVSCKDFISPGGKTWTQSGSYIDTIPNASGCDSILNYEITINHPSESQLTVTTCDTYISPSGKIWSESGVYSDTIDNNKGCDSVISVNLTIPEVNVNVVQSEDTLFAATGDATYRWLQCDDYLPVEGAVGQKFVPLVSGNYSVEVTQSGCSDTSDCFDVTITGVGYNTLGDDLMIYPNPARSKLTIHLPQAYEKTGVEIRNLSGQTLLKEVHRGKQRIDLTLDMPSGVYLLSIRNNLNQGALLKLVVE